MSRHQGKSSKPSPYQGNALPGPQRSMAGKHGGAVSCAKARKPPCDAAVCHGLPQSSALVLLLLMIVASCNCKLSASHLNFAKLMVADRCRLKRADSGLYTSCLQGNALLLKSCADCQLGSYHLPAGALLRVCMLLSLGAAKACGGVLSCMCMNTMQAADRVGYPSELPYLHCEVFDAGRSHQLAQLAQEVARGDGLIVQLWILKRINGRKYRLIELLPETPKQQSQGCHALTWLQHRDAHGRQTWKWCAQAP